MNIQRFSTASRLTPLLLTSIPTIAVDNRLSGADKHRRAFPIKPLLVTSRKSPLPLASKVSRTA